MKKMVLLLVLFAATHLFAQVKPKGVTPFGNTSFAANFQFSNTDNYAIDYQKYINFPIQFSIYNPKPGFTPTKMDSQKYYSFKNTNLLLKREMSNREPEPIYPNQDKKKSFGETIFSDVLEGVFSKK
ncbi:hypothetical protein SD960_20660 [Flavobacterium sp. MMLR14_040]|uniref:hypothetical protein n=1 Tax=Flavobacterium sp. MMLR14_040 TaxID=3093843 RepID=UPI00298F4B9A|nr:hypothetical protein [Flavobacterium sp. MMLR14_040]MDW8852525.1 hypothetical protein [Flavobacterium sp. MMLR14_040]